MQANWSIVPSSRFVRFLTFSILRYSMRSDWSRRFDGIWKDSPNGAESKFDSRSIPPDLSRLKPDIETAIFRIIQEALTNMFRHSGARNGSVSLTEE